MAVNYPEIVERYFEISSWTIGKVNKFPKDIRFTLGARIAAISIKILEDFIEVSLSKATEKIQGLKTISLQIEQIKYLFRMACDLKAVSQKSTHFFIIEMQKISASIGAWIKSVGRKGEQIQ